MHPNKKAPSVAVESEIPSDEAQPERPDTLCPVELRDDISALDGFLILLYPAEGKAKKFLRANYKKHAVSPNILRESRAEDHF